MTLVLKNPERNENRFWAEWGCVRMWDVAEATDAVILLFWMLNSDLKWVICVAPLRS